MDSIEDLKALEEEGNAFLERFEQKMGLMLKEPRVRRQADEKAAEIKALRKQVEKAVEVAQRSPSNDNVAIMATLKRQLRALEPVAPDEPAAKDEKAKPVMYCEANGTPLAANGWCDRCRKVHAGHNPFPNHSQNPLMKHVALHGLR